jgi:tetratricopeptide (TPR) repeat protein
MSEATSNATANLPSDVRDALIEARTMAVQGRLLDAERIYRSLAGDRNHKGLALEALSDLYLQQQRMDEAHGILETLVQENPDSLHYCGVLAGFLDAAGQVQDAVDEYQRFIERNPDVAVAHFNLALLLKKQQQYSEALAAYDAAIRLGIEQPQEAYSNMGVIYSEMRQADKAQALYERAIELSPDYVPALFNLGGHYEELGEKQLALDIYERILALDPRHWPSLARLAYPQKISADNTSLVDRLHAGIREAGEDQRAQEGLFFALGKAYDDLELYDEAAAAYKAANEISKGRVRPYSPAATEEAFDKLIELFDADWIEAVRTDSDFSPIFICGMYRSGSTLLERMLGSHPNIAAGGELDVLPWLIGRHLGQFPQAAASATRAQLQRIAEEYEAQVSKLVPESPIVIDKRPDNFLRVALIRAIFPTARIIQTRRELRDNVLSLYFQQFDRAASYANDLQHIAHYYLQQERLFAHWRECCGDDLVAVDYEQLVESPEPTLRRVLDFLEVEWHPAVLEFHAGGGMVKTASIWQVRQGLHSGSRERWRNYQSLLGDLAQAPSAGPAMP